MGIILRKLTPLTPLLYHAKNIFASFLDNKKSPVFGPFPDFDLYFAPKDLWC